MLLVMQPPRTWPRAQGQQAPGCAVHGPSCLRKRVMRSRRSANLTLAVSTRPARRASSSAFLRQHTSVRAYNSAPMFLRAPASFCSASRISANCSVRPTAWAWPPPRSPAQLFVGHDQPRCRPWPGSRECREHDYARKPTETASTAGASPALASAPTGLQHGCRDT